VCWRKWVGVFLCVGEGGDCVCVCVSYMYISIPLHLYSHPSPPSFSRFRSFAHLPSENGVEVYTWINQSINQSIYPSILFILIYIDRSIHPFIHLYYIDRSKSISQSIYPSKYILNQPRLCTHPLRKDRESPPAPAVIVCLLLLGCCLQTAPRGVREIGVG
jgi:hypothetical protein